ncbi:uncharacterized protein LOC135430940 isoform X3 [Drosophila montana]|uniref:uncharacterized protein LOC135430940 isoform X2 n=1 Tax=Drosophila montana TaxID=40370 RepID=UPI00313AF7E8
MNIFGKGNNDTHTIIHLHTPTNIDVILGPSARNDGSMSRLGEEEPRPRRAKLSKSKKYAPPNPTPRDQRKPLRAKTP